MRDGRRKDLLCLAVIAPLALLPIYHRTYDTRLLMLTFPAVALLWGTRTLLGPAALVVSTLVTGLTFSQLRNSGAFHRAAAAFHSSQHSGLTTILFTRPVPTACLLSAVFFLGCCYAVMRDESALPSSEAVEGRAVQV